jgi:hypothetical protein
MVGWFLMVIVEIHRRKRACDEERIKTPLLMRTLSDEPIADATNRWSPPCVMRDA